MEGRKAAEEKKEKTLDFESGWLPEFLSCFPASLIKTSPRRVARQFPYWDPRKIIGNPNIFSIETK